MSFYEFEQRMSGVWVSQRCIDSTGWSDSGKMCCWHRTCAHVAEKGRLTCYIHADLEKEARALAAHVALQALNGGTE